MYFNIDHIAVYAKDINQLVKFYVDVLGFVERSRTYHKDGNVKMVRVPVNSTQCIEFFNFDNFKSPKDGYVASGYMHIGFVVEDIDSIIVKLGKSGVPSLEQKYKGADGYYHVFFKDPEFNQIELTQH